MVLTRSKSIYVGRPEETGWGVRLAEAIDEAIHRAGADRDVVSVAVTPLATDTYHGGSPTAGVVVTVVWREARGA